MAFGDIGTNSGLPKVRDLKLKIPHDLIKTLRDAQHITVLTGAGIISRERYTHLPGGANWLMGKIRS